MSPHLDDSLDTWTTFALWHKLWPGAVVLLSALFFIPGRGSIYTLLVLCGLFGVVLAPMPFFLDAFYFDAVVYHDLLQFGTRGYLYGRYR